MFSAPKFYRRKNNTNNLDSNYISKTIHYMCSFKQKKNNTTSYSKKRILESFCCTHTLKNNKSLERDVQPVSRSEMNNLKDS